MEDGSNAMSHGVTPSDRLGDRCRRMVDAASAHFASGDAPRAKALLEVALDAAEPGGSRAAVLEQLATVVWATDGDQAAVEAYRHLQSCAKTS